MSKTISALVILAMLLGGSAWLLHKADGDWIHRLHEPAPAPVPGTVRVTRTDPAADNGNNGERLPVQPIMLNGTDSATATETVQETAAAVTVSAEKTEIANTAVGSTEGLRAMLSVAPVETLPISGTIRQSNAVQLVDWQTGADAAGHFTFTGRVIHSHLAGPVYSTAVIHVYNNNRLIAMLPVEEFPRRVYTNVPHTFTLQTEIDVTDVQRYAFYINVTTAKQIASEDSQLCPNSDAMTASASCTPPTF